MTEIEYKLRPETVVFLWSFSRMVTILHFIGGKVTNKSENGHHKMSESAQIMVTILAFVRGKVTIKLAFVPQKEK